MPRNTKRGSLGSCDVCEMSDQGNPRPPEPDAKPDAVAMEPDAVALEPDGLPRGLRWLKEHLPKDRILKKQDIENRVSILAFSIDIWLQFSCPQVLRKISIFYHQNIDIQ